MKLIYFAWLRTRIGLGEEHIALPDGVHDVAALIDWLKTRGPGYEAALADASVIRVAVNQDYVKPDHVLAAGDEVALFPPVTGG